MMNIPKTDCIQKYTLSKSIVPLLIAGILLAVMTACSNPSGPALPPPPSSTTVESSGGDSGGSSEDSGKNPSALYISNLTRDVTYTRGRPLSLIVKAEAGNGGVLTYQWYSNTSTPPSNTGGTAVTGETKMIFKPNTNTVGTYYYYVMITSASLKVSVVSDLITVVINTEINAQQPNITSLSGDQILTYGDTPATTPITVTATSPDGGTLTYQWFSNTTNSTSGGTAIDGATKASYKPPMPALGVTMYYYCEVTNTIRPNGDLGNKSLMQASNTVRVSYGNKNLTITGLSAQNKEYDGGTSVTVTGTPVIVGKIEGDDVDLVQGSIAFPNKAVQASKNLVFSGWSLTGADAGHYTLVTPTLTAAITAKPVTITGLGAQNKVYDGLSTATVTGTPVINGVISGDDVTVTTGSAVFIVVTGNTVIADKNVGSNKVVRFGNWGLNGNDRLNYSLPQQPGDAYANITQKPLTVTVSKEYDGTPNITIVKGVLSSPYSTGDIVLDGVVTTTQGLITRDRVYIKGSTGTAEFDDQHIGTDKDITWTGGILELDDTQVVDGFPVLDNYSVTYSIDKGTITPKALTSVSITQPVRKLIPFNSADTVYGTTTTFELTVSGLVTGETPTLGLEVAKGSSYGLSLSGATTISDGVLASPITLTYNASSAVPETTAFDIKLVLPNYTLPVGSDAVNVTVYDGQDAARAIPVTQDNLAAFNTYANTDGLTWNYRLTGNVTVSAAWSPIGNDTTFFTGSFDGGNNSITDLTITGASYLGMFGYIGSGGTVSNLTLINAAVSGGVSVGAVAGQNSGTVNNCTTTGGTVTGASAVGGVVGTNDGTVSNCTAGNVSVETSSPNYTFIGRVVGRDSSTLGLSNNRGSTSMTVTYDSGGTPTPKIIVSDPNGIDGEDYP